ncbi:MAG: YjbH domain-containing protein [Pacificibacter sp.]|uniref:YjbH domain-containing protein n=1 Tax=Pacificibacter sp. TaxID=1917866 RepID=UPI00321B2722
MSSHLPQVLLIGSMLAATCAEAAELRFPVSTYGTPGLVDMPSGEVFPDGQLNIATSFNAKTQKYNLAFQISPKLYGGFRYSVLDNLDGPGQNRYDRSFDLAYMLLAETAIRPSVVVGLRDFGGTGLFGSEYVAATKHLLDDSLALTAGIGWGRFGSHGGFENPLSVFGDAFKTRGAGPVSIEEVGRLETDQWFRGDAALFGGLAYQINDRIQIRAEYSSDAYAREIAHMGFEYKSPVNVALTYGFKSGTDVSAYVLHGSKFGVMANFVLSPENPKVPGGVGEAPPALMSRQSAAALSWDAGSVAQKDSPLALALAEQGLILDGVSTTNDSATVRLINTRFDAQAQAIGRAARVMANTLPSNISTFKIESTAKGMTTSRTTLHRNDLEALEYDLDGSRASFARADIADAARSEAATLQGAYPNYSWVIQPYFEPSLFDPDNPIRANFGLQVGAAVEAARGLVFSGLVRQPLLGNLDESTRESNSILPHVRTDSATYAKRSGVQIKSLMVEKFFRPGTNLYARGTVGYLETMYGGASGELLWRPVSSPLALGLELNYAVKRDFDQLFGFQDYDIVTGHASGYYDFGNGYLGQLDVGRYLAGDYGVTVSFDREFNNGIRVGAYFTLTDVPFTDFGEGSFDKGIRFSIPVSWISGMPNQNDYGLAISPVTRDGGARLYVPNRLFELTRDSQTNELEDQWGRFWR